MEQGFKTIAVDWDGTLVEYNGFRGVGMYGAPVPKMVNRVKKWLKEGHMIVIFTSRVSDEHSIKTIAMEIATIRTALRDMGLPQLQITANKSIKFSEIWDDRAVAVNKNAGTKVCPVS